MNDNALHNRIAEASKTLFSYCMARTPNRWEAEDLCQDILCELVKSSARLRDERAFYAFMWSLAGNVYKQWCRKRAGARTCPLPEDVAEIPAAAADDESEEALTSCGASCPCFRKNTAARRCCIIWSGNPAPKSRAALASARAWSSICCSNPERN